MFNTFCLTDEALSLLLYAFKDDHSRVILETSRNESDYINANYIEVN